MYSSFENYYSNSSLKQSFSYNASYARKKVAFTDLNSGQVTQTNYYSGGYQKIKTGQGANQSTTEINYISTPTGLGAVYVEDANGTNLYFSYTDHQGSITKLTDQDGNIVHEQTFDAWGKRTPLNPPPAGGGSANPNNPDFSWLRGYTGHEHLEEFDLINMNGRLYDPSTARMLSPDNFVQSPFYSQNYNRYTYVYNNPLKYTDPTGMVSVGTAATFQGNRNMENANDYYIDRMLAFQDRTDALADMNPLYNDYYAVTGGGDRMYLGSSIGGGDISLGEVGGLNQTLKFDTYGSAYLQYETRAEYVKTIREMTRGADGVITDGLGLFENRLSGELFTSDAHVIYNREKAYLNQFNNDIVSHPLLNLGSAMGMFTDWVKGDNNYRVFVNNSEANAFRNASKVNAARNAFYKKFKGKQIRDGSSLTNYIGGFGPLEFLGTIDPMEHFVGSYRVDIHAFDNQLLFRITNPTSFESFLYGIGPNWEGGIMGNFRQEYIFTEPIK